MLETHIYIATDNISPKTTDRHYGYVLECKVEGEVNTREGFGVAAGTYHKATLLALIDALKRFNQTCEIYIHTENKYILNMMQHNMSKWAGTGFTTSKGKPVANREEWAKLWSLAKKQLIHTVHGKHSYSGWLSKELKKRKE